MRWPIVVVKTEDRTTLDHLLEKHDARIVQHESYPVVEYRLHCPALPGVLIVTPDDLDAAARASDDPATAAYTLLLTKFVAALDAEGIEP